MAFRTVGIFSIGQMGAAWARLLREHGIRVVTHSGGRGERTRRLRDDAGVEELPGVEQAVEEADLIVSLVPPTAAPLVASSVARATRASGASPVFLEANAISPRVALEIAEAMGEAGGICVDGAIIGGAATLPGGCVVYLSGPEAYRVKPLEICGLRLAFLGESIGQASALKMVYAGLNKGLAAQLTEALVTARAVGVFEPALEKFREDFAGLMATMERFLPSFGYHAARRAEEMDEYGAMAEEAGLKAIMAPATGILLRGIAALGLGEVPAGGGGAQAEVFIERLADAGFMRGGSSR
jgi:3-hydroxyisobutyrate dehydrogenase-like beta-hydroxyacid dehydrogenase